MFGLIVNKILYDPAVTVKPVRTFGEIAHYSPSPTEFGQYASFILLAAFCAAIALIADNWSQRKSVLSSGWLPVAFAAVILLFLSFGIGPHKLQKTGLYKFFYHYFPFFSYQRVPTKIFAPVVCLLMALSAVLVEKLISRMRTKEQPYKRAIYSLMVAALLSSVAYHAGFFFYQLHQSRRLSLMALDSDRLGHLRKYVEANAIILNLPLREKMDTMANYAQYLAFNSDRRVANGYVGNPPRYFRESQEALSYLNEGWLTSRGADRIREHGFDYIWLDASQFPSAEAMRITVERLRQIKGLECVFCGSKEALFKIDALNLSPNRLYTFGWGMPSSRVEKTGRWMVKDDSPVHAEYAHLNFKPYDVMSFVQLAPQEGGRKVAIVLQTAVREPLIVIGAKGEKVSLTPPDFGEGSKQLEFAWSGTSFYLAIEHAYLPLKDGIPDQSNYGHFIESITETVGGESHQLSVF